MVKEREAWRAAVHGVLELDVAEGLNENKKNWFAQSGLLAFPYKLLHQCVSQSSTREGEPEGQIHVKRFRTRNWLMELWGLTKQI